MRCIALLALILVTCSSCVTPSPVQDHQPTRMSGSQIKHLALRTQSTIYMSTTNRLARAFADAHLESWRSLDDGIVTDEELTQMNKRWPEVMSRIMIERNVEIFTFEEMNEAQAMWLYHWMRIKDEQAARETNSPSPPAPPAPEPSNYLMKGMLEEIGRKTITPEYSR